MAVLTLNAGSSSLKFALFDAGRALVRGEVEAIDTDPKASATDADGKATEPPTVPGRGHEAVFPALFDWAARHAAIDAVGHRIVHGGDAFTGPVRIDDAALVAMEALIPLAPLHQPHNIAAIRAVAAAQPGLPQVACFDTAFHRTMPDTARRHALPDRLGLRRYGFHGLSYEWIAGRLPPALAAGRVVAAHLGSGASLCALQAGRSVETTMSTTPLDGLVMGTRCGALDPGVVLHLVRQMGADATEHLLYHEAGLLGVSGESADMRALHASGSPGARAAIELFTDRVAADVAALATALGGLDALVFTGGIGEHDAPVRDAIVARLAWMGPMQVLVIPADEEAVIARQVRAVLAR